ncbi:MAG: ATP-binding protein [Cyanobacteria bacterium P01_H01_bin.58]
MAKPSPASSSPLAWPRSVVWLRVFIAPLYQRYGNLSIDKKLILSFGLLVSITFLVVGTTFVGGLGISYQVAQTRQVHVPTALTGAQAKTDLLKMMSNVRGYLATAESEFRNQYQISRLDFEAEIAAMRTLLNEHNTSAGMQRDLRKLESLYRSWLSLPEQMFTLRDNEIENQPALKLLQEEGEIVIAQILRDLDQLIAANNEAPPTSFSISALQNIVDFKSAFAVSTAALRSYLVTRNSTFRFNYADQAKVSQLAWEQVTQQASGFNAGQQELLAAITQTYDRYQSLSTELFNLVETDAYRQDLLIFQTQAEPLATQILAVLREIIDEEQVLLSQQLARTGNWIVVTQWQTLIGGGVSLALAIALAIFLRRDIAIPIRHLTVATARIMEGDYSSQARVESRDEIGVLADTFNRMTQFLRRSRAELEDYSRSLESKVAQRTQELEHKNHQLTTAVEELQRTQSQLVQTEKMSSLGQLVAGVAHEINNPVNFISGNVIHASSYTEELIELVKRYQTALPRPGPEIQTYIQDIDLAFLIEDMPRSLSSMQVGAQRIQEIVASLKTFSRMDEAEMKAVDLHDGIDSTLMILRSRLKQTPIQAGITIEKNYGDLPQVECYPGQLNQVFMNILSNAIDALEAKQEEEPGLQAKITITTACWQKSSIVISIQDNGPGIAPQHRARLFDPFYTTKPVGKGTGLGLSISYQVIAERHHGELSCESEIGEGSTFRVTIPIHQEVEPSIPAE